MKKHSNRHNWNRQRVINYWLAMAEYQAELGNIASADESLTNAIWSENANMHKFNKQCAQWYREDQQYWDSLPRQSELFAA